MSKNYIHIYTDGSVNESENYCTWCYIVVHNKKQYYQEVGRLHNSGGPDVERAESEAIYKACEFAWNHPSNYTIFTDSKSFLNKISDKCANATKSPHVNGVKKILKQFEQSPEPISLQIKFKARCSDEWSKAADNLSKNSQQN